MVIDIYQRHRSICKLFIRFPAQIIIFYMSFSNFSNALNDLLTYFYYLKWLLMLRLSVLITSGMSSDKETPICSSTCTINIDSAIAL